MQVRKQQLELDMERRHLALYVNDSAGGGHRIERSVHAEVRKWDTSRQEINLRLLRKLHGFESPFPYLPIVKSRFKTVHFTEGSLETVTHYLLKTRKPFRLEVSAITRERNHLSLMQYGAPSIGKAFHRIIIPNYRYEKLCG